MVLKTLDIIGSIGGPFIGVFVGWLIGRRRVKVYKATFDNVHRKGVVVFHFPKGGNEMVMIRHHDREGKYTGRASLVIDGETEELINLWFDKIRHLRPESGQTGIATL